jgi:hypothetical protein
MRVRVCFVLCVCITAHVCFGSTSQPLLLVRMAHDVAKAMSYLHEKGIVHCSTSSPHTPSLHSRFLRVNTNILPCGLFLNQTWSPKTFWYAQRQESCALQ